MSNYMTKAAAHARLIKLARAAHYIRRQRALQKYAQAVRMQKYALDIDLSGHKVGVGAGIGALGGGLLGAGLGYGFGAKDKKLMSTLLGAGIGTGVGAGLGAGAGYLLGKPADTPKSVVATIADRENAVAKAKDAWKANGYKDLAPGMSLTNDDRVIMNGEVVGYRRHGWFGRSKFVPATKFGPGMRISGTTVIDNKTGEPIGTRIADTDLVDLTPVLPKKPTAVNVQNNEGYPIVLPYGTMS